MTGGLEVSPVTSGKISFWLVRGLIKINTVMQETFCEIMIF